MGSAAVQHLVTDHHIHVGFDRACRYWWAVGTHGSYGGHRSLAQVIKIAQDAAASTHTQVVVHTTKGRVSRTLPAASHVSPQFFQDDVP